MQPAQLMTANQATSSPAWLKYLVGAYPQQKPSAATMAVFEQQFIGIDHAVMMTAVQGYVSENKYWPAVSELRRYVKEPQEQHVLPFHIWHNRIYAPRYWMRHEPCGELTPDVNDCPFCMDILAKE